MTNVDAAGHAAPDRWRPGTVLLGQYVVQRRYHGGMSYVFHVQNTAGGIDQAMKVPRPGKLRFDHTQSTFEAEAATWISLGLHPHVAFCHYTRRVEGWPCIFSQYEPHTLDELIGDGSLLAGQGDLIVSRILRLGVHVAWGLTHAHQAGVAHLDVKPSNILVTNGMVARVSDFGVAKAVGRTASGGAYYSAEYCSPEHISGAPGMPSDVWSFGLCLLAMCAGGVFWAEHGRPTGLDAHTHLAAWMRREVDAVVSTASVPGLADILQSCFEPSPAARPDMAALGAALRTTFEQVLGQPFTDELPAPGTLIADGLTNRGLSWLDLGDELRAEQSFTEAIAAHPHHAAATYNRGLHLWRQSTITDEELLHRMAQAESSHPGSDLTRHLIGLVHLERGDRTAARRVADALDEASELSPVEELLAPVEEISTQAWAATMTPDAQVVLCSGTHHAAELWRPGNVMPLLRLESHQAPVTAVALTGDGRRAVTGSLDGTVRLWDLSPGYRMSLPAGLARFLRELDLGQPVAAVALTQDGRHLLVTGRSGVRWWDLATHRSRTMTAHRGDVVACAISSDGRYALTGADDQTVRLWDTATEDATVVQTADSPITSVTLGADGRSVLCGAASGQTILFDLHTAAVHDLSGHRGAVHAVALSSKAQLAITGGDDATVRLWHVPSLRCLRTIAVGGPVRALTITPDDRHVLCAGRQQQPRIWALSSTLPPKARWFYPRPQLRSEAFIRNAAQVGLAYDQAHQLWEQGRLTESAALVRQARQTPGFQHHRPLVELWHRLGTSGVRTGWGGSTQVRTLHWPDVMVTAIAIAGPRTLISGERSGTIRVTDLVTNAERVLGRQAGPVTCMAVASQAETVIVGDEHDRTTAWDLAGGTPAVTVTEHRGPVIAVAVTADGRMIVSSGLDCVMKARDQTMPGSLVLAQVDRPHGALAVSAEGLVIAGGMDGRVRIWDRGGRLTRTMKGHRAAVGWITLALGHPYVVSASDDHDCRVWTPGNGRAMQVWKGHTGPINAVAISTDATHAITGADDATLRVWRMSDGTCVATLPMPGPVRAVALGDDNRLLAILIGDTISVRELDWRFAWPGEPGIAE